MYALVTGASSGIGYELAKQLAAHGFDLILTARREERLKELEQKLIEDYPINVKSFPCDLRHLSQVKNLTDEIKNLDVRFVANCAGFGKVGYVLDYDMQTDLDMIATNITALHYLTKRMANQMKKGRIVNIASMAAFQPGPGMAVYGATKSYVVNFSRAMNYELKKQGQKVRIVTCCPGPVETEFASVAGSTKEQLDDSMYGQLLTKVKDRFKVTAAQCAQQIVEDTLAGKEYIIPGNANLMLKLFGRFVPEDCMLWAEEKIQSHKKK